jgi:hypothetical protein
MSQGKSLVTSFEQHDVTGVLEAGLTTAECTGAVHTLNLSNHNVGLLYECTYGRTWYSPSQSHASAIIFALRSTGSSLMAEMSGGSDRGVPVGTPAAAAAAAVKHEEASQCGENVAATSTALPLLVRTTKAENSTYLQHKAT